MNLVMSMLNLRICRGRMSRRIYRLEAQKSVLDKRQKSEVH